MKIALIADSHNSWEKLREAIQAANEKDCDVLFFAGDLVRPKGVDVLAEFAGPVHMILGNNEFQIDEIWARAEATDNVIYHGEVCDIGRGGLRIFMHHYPAPAEAKAREGAHDLCIHGHTHSARSVTIEQTRLVNPGAISPRGSQPEWAIYNSDDDLLDSYKI